MAFEGVKRFFSNDCETNDLLGASEKSKDVTTHYYATSYEKAKTAICDIGKGMMKLQVMNIDDHYHEVFLESNSESIICVLTVISAYETAIDFKVKTNHLIGFNRPMKKCGEFYNWLNQRLTLKHIGGGKNDFQ